MNANSRIIVLNIPKHLTESALKSHFSELGNVTDCRIMFRGQKNRGFAFVGFRNASSASQAISRFNGTFIGTRRISVKYALLRGDEGLKTRRKNPKTGEGAGSGAPEETRSDALKNRLFVKNFPFTVSEDELRTTFEEFGELNECRIIRNQEQKSRGFGFVGFVENVSAAKAFEALHNKSKEKRENNWKACSGGF